MHKNFKNKLLQAAFTKCTAFKSWISWEINIFSCNLYIFLNLNGQYVGDLNNCFIWHRKIYHHLLYDRYWRVLTTSSTSKCIIIQIRCLQHSRRNLDNFQMNAYNFYQQNRWQSQVIKALVDRSVRKFISFDLFFSYTGWSS